MDGFPQELLIKFVGAVWFGSGREFYQELDEKQRSVLLTATVHEKLEPLLYYALSESLPPEYLELCRKKYQAASILALKSQVKFGQLCGVLRAGKIRFAPFKGVDLAARCYPAAALRSFCDWDVLIHPDDCAGALQLLAEDNWQALRKVDLNTRHYHFAVHEKDGFCLEPHWTFSQFDGINARDLWDYIKPVDDENLQHLLTPELNILQLTRHASFNNYNHLPLIKLLQDAAVLLRHEKINWDKLRTISERWNLPYPGDMLAVWSDFFPRDVIERMKPDREQVRRFQQIYQYRKQCHNVAPGEWAMSRHQGKKLDFIRHSLAQVTPEALIKKYHLPKYIGYLLLLGIYPWDLGRKFFRYCRYVLQPDKNMQEFQQMVDAVEKKDAESK